MTLQSNDETILNVYHMMSLNDIFCSIKLLSCIFEIFKNMNL